MTTAPGSRQALHPNLLRRALGELQGDRLLGLRPRRLAVPTRVDRYCMLEHLPPSTLLCIHVCVFIYIYIYIYIYIFIEYVLCVSMCLSPYLYASSLYMHTHAHDLVQAHWYQSIYPFMPPSLPLSVICKYMCTLFPMEWVRLLGRAICSRPPN